MPSCGGDLRPVAESKKEFSVHAGVPRNGTARPRAVEGSGSYSDVVTSEALMSVLTQRMTQNVYRNQLKNKVAGL